MPALPKGPRPRTNKETQVVKFMAKGASYRMYLKSKPTLEYIRELARLLIESEDLKVSISRIGYFFLFYIVYLLLQMCFRYVHSSRAIVFLQNDNDVDDAIATRTTNGRKYFLVF